jgi:hypothetical protein
MMPRPPYPNAIRAVIGFVLGLAIGTLVVGLFRYLIQGIDAYAVPIKIMDGLFAGWFWDDEATFMFAFLAGAIGFMWGAGAVYDFPKEEQLRAANTKALTRIPVDPDAPKPAPNPAQALFPAIPSMGVTVIVIVVAVLIVVGLTIAPVGIRQASENEADIGTLDSEAEFGLLGLDQLDFTGENKALIFVVFSVIVLGGIMTTAAILGGTLYFLNRQVKVAEVVEPDPNEGKNFLPIRLAAFFTDWAVDMLNGISAVLRPR